MKFGKFIPVFFDCFVKYFYTKIVLPYFVFKSIDVLCDIEVSLNDVLIIFYSVNSLKIF